ncbi:Putative thioredoxin reductase-like selenoprotein T protein [Sarcoptes scabiei]|uniref:SelT-like protein n=2 Tax=Sarcoptes scabiei TaxID=52283 RepID=A0A834R9M8_SARSC|nr:Putative thioredoxin reductase-like selenoprotein T protein [Sarcoptes scabiei]
MDRNICFIVFVIFVVYTARDLFYKFQPSSSKSMNDFEGNIKKEIPAMNFRTVQSGPTIKFLYCYSCGYQRAFEEYRKMILDQFPEINVIGNNYNPSYIKSRLVQLISTAKMIIIALLITNISPFTYFGVNTPQFWLWMREHKLYACLMVFFLSNTFESQLMSSGAFEIFYNDVPIWSKLTTGRIPSPNELIDMIENQHKFDQSAMFTSGPIRSTSTSGQS